MDTEKSTPSAKPYDAFLLFPALNGQWRKDTWDSDKKRSVSYYFGPWEDDPKGECALVEYMGRKAAIANGTDVMRVDAGSAELTA